MIDLLTTYGSITDHDLCEATLKSVDGTGTDGMKPSIVVIHFNIKQRPQYAAFAMQECNSFYVSLYLPICTIFYILRARRAYETSKARFSAILI